MDFQEAARFFIEKYSKKIVEAGYTPGITWVDSETQKAYISCQESRPGTYGGSTKEAIYSHESRNKKWRGVSGNI